MPEEELTCREVVEAVTEYLEGTMATRERRRFDEHLAYCSWCVSYLDQMRTTVAITGSLRVEDLALETQTRLVEAFRSWKRGRRRV